MEAIPMGQSQGEGIGMYSSFTSNFRATFHGSLQSTILQGLVCHGRFPSLLSAK